MNPRGNWVIRPVYREVLEFSDQIRSCQNSWELELINSAGEIDSSFHLGICEAIQKWGWVVGELKRERLLDQ